MAPFVGGVLGAMFVGVCPLIENRAILLIPLFIDPGVWFGIIPLPPPLRSRMRAGRPTGDGEEAAQD